MENKYFTLPRDWVRRIHRALRVSMVTTVLLFAAASHVCAAVDGDRFTVGGVDYKVMSATDMSVCALSINNDNTAAEVDIPETVTYRDEQFKVIAFGGQWSDNGSVKVIKLPSTVTTINSMAISGNNHLTDFYIPSSVATISQGIGSEATHFPKFHVEGTRFAVDGDGLLYSADKKVLYAVPSSVAVTDGKYALPDGVTTIGGEVLAGMSGLTAIVLPASLEYIASGAFTNANNSKVTTVAVASGNTHFKIADNGALIKLNAAGSGADTLIYYPIAHEGATFTVPADVTVLASSCIAYNSHITEVDLNKIVTTTSGALSNLNSLTTLGISASVTSLDGFVSNCPNIITYNIDKDNQVYQSKDGIVFTKDGTKLVLYPSKRPDTEYTIPEGTTTIPMNTFNNCLLEKLTVAASVISLNEESFASMPNLTELDFAPGSKLTSLWWQNIVSLPKLKKIILPTGVKEILARGIWDCPSLEEIVVPDGSQLTTLDQNCFGTPALKHFTFAGASVLTTIGDEVFSGKTHLESITIPATVTTIGKSAFKGCTGLKQITFASGSQIKTLGDGCFAECGFETLDLPDQIESIGAEAFRSCTQLKNVHFSATLKSIDPTAFKWCTGITAYTVDEANPYYSATHGMLCDKSKTTLMLYPAGLVNDEATVIPPSITAIGDHAFYNCENLTNVVIPQKVTKIGARAFGLDNQLNSITLLCDAMIDPSNVKQGDNDMSFDDGTLGGETTNMYGNITLYVRKDLQSQYEANSFWQKFKAIKTSFIVEHPGSTSGETDEFLPLSQKGLLLISTTSKSPIYVAPQSVVNSSDADESSYQRNVNMVDSYAFEGCDGIREVIFKNSIYSIGALAFYTQIQSSTSGGTTIHSPKSSSIKDIIFCGNQAPEVMISDYFDLQTAGDYYAFSSDQKIYTKKSTLDAYKAAMSHFKDQISYQIPGVSITHTYSTFCREFDTDFSDYYQTNNQADIAAFVAGYEHTGTDADGNTVNLIHMTSIDLNGGYTADGTHTYGYIPANTGVLLKVLDQDGKTPDDFYYTIGEHDAQTYTLSGNLMNGVLDESTTVDASQDHPVYVMQKSTGKLVKVTSPISNFPIHKAYLTLPATASSKYGLSLVFDRGGVTAIDAPKVDRQDDGQWYDLSGRPVSHPQHGIYIHHGAKIMIK